MNLDVDLFEIQIIERYGYSSPMIGGLRVITNIPPVSSEINPGLWLLTPSVSRPRYTETMYILDMNYIPTSSDAKSDDYYLFRNLIVNKLKKDHYI